MRRGKSAWFLLIFLIIGSFIGSLLGQALGGTFPWLNLSSRAYGLNPPLVLNFDLFALTIGLTVRLSVAGVIGLLLGLLVYVRI